MQWAALAGLGGGILLGLAARLGRFCTLGAIEDYLYAESDTRLRMFGLAICLSVIGTFTLAALGLFDPTTSFYLSSRWNPVASVTGGLMFGYGMALAGNCGYGALARAGGGDLRAMVIVIVMGIAAYMAIAGPTAALRAWVFPVSTDVTTPPSIPTLLATALPLPAWAIGIALGLAGTAILLAAPAFRANRAALFWSAVVALAITSGWAATHYLAVTGFDGIRPASHTFSAPVGETLIYAMTWTGSRIDFGIGSVVGVLVGAFLGSLRLGHFRWEACEDPRELKRQLLGAFLMGTGAVIALGCSVGQGLSAFSVLAYSAPVTLGAIFAGAALGLRHLIYGLNPGRSA